MIPLKEPDSFLAFTCSFTYHLSVSHEHCGQCGGDFMDPLLQTPLEVSVKPGSAPLPLILVNPPSLEHTSSTHDEFPSVCGREDL
jgi:hypothetical protein